MRLRIPFWQSPPQTFKKPLEGIPLLNLCLRNDVLIHVILRVTLKNLNTVTVYLFTALLVNRTVYVLSQS